jgi:hypothetical protein
LRADCFIEILNSCDFALLLFGVWQCRVNPARIAFAHSGVLAQAALAFAAFLGQDVTGAGAMPTIFACSRDFEPLGCGFACFLFRHDFFYLSLAVFLSVLYVLPGVFRVHRNLTLDNAKKDVPLYPFDVIVTVKEETSHLRSSDRGGGDQAQFFCYPTGVK